MQHPELVPIGMLAMLACTIPGILLGRRIRSWRVYAGVFLLTLLSGGSAWYFRHSVDIGYFAFLFVPPLFGFALLMGSKMQGMDDRMVAYRKRCLDAQYKQLESDKKHFNALVLADTWAAIAGLHSELGESEKAVEAYGEAAKIYAVEKGNHPTLAAFYRASSEAHRKVKRNLDADRLAVTARECALKVEY